MHLEAIYHWLSANHPDHFWWCSQLSATARVIDMRPEPFRCRWARGSDSLREDRTEIWESTWKETSCHLNCSGTLGDSSPLTQPPHSFEGLIHDGSSMFIVHPLVSSMHHLLFLSLPLLCVLFYPFLTLFWLFSYSNNSTTCDSFRGPFYGSQ